MRIIDLDTARWLAVVKQRLAGPALSTDEDGILQLIRELGCVQIDPIRAVERTQYLVLWSRLGPYDPAVLDSLLWEKKLLFEYWAHAASIVLTEDYPIFRTLMADWAVSRQPWMMDAEVWVEDRSELRDYIINELEANGPLSVSELTNNLPGEWESPGMTKSQVTTQMVTNLWLMGVIMVSHRTGTNKFWDLTERCLPDWTPGEFLSVDSMESAAVRRSVKALGVATAKHIGSYFIRGRYTSLDQVLGRLLDEGQIQRIRVEDHKQTKNEDWYIHSELLPLLNQIETKPPVAQATLLSPFDNLISDRDRTEQLFDFYYRMEIYTPKARRQYGYYVMPILYGNQLIGRIDPLMDRKKKELSINAVYPESDAPMNGEVAASIADAILSLASFLGAERVAIRGELPDGWRRQLTEWYEPDAAERS